MGGDHETAGRPPHSGDYRSDLIASLTRILGEWTAPEFLTAVAARGGVHLDAAAIVTVTVLANHGPQRPSALAAHLVTGASNASKIIRRLTEAGFAVREPDPEDARAQLITLTEAGRKVAASFVCAGDGLVDELLEGWCASDREVFTDLLQRFEKATVALAAGLRPATTP
ncbi:MarR family winged helix-turn-helix transcriptional regulator [Paeniglutamicibacter cryotolerans]|uniref:DNA-binding MarR family transcriptional regulator n=1 Tax=Paeniglutamicibacter cryotolerans TaxID=670079 RepID=A0A839QH59_9MICC|nr:MarR family winged helix-turn-helix transcriptional regulator [Paeniglutamicibacter cryotolerans]MBB2995230.1 DNA-binding MarR family transcriptional regulator [Paeniglutamicibacter cryotolerans]